MSESLSEAIARRRKDPVLKERTQRHLTENAAALGRLASEPWYIYGLAARYGTEPDQWIGPVVYIGKTDSPARRVREHACGAAERLHQYEEEYAEWEKRAARTGDYTDGEPESPAPFTYWLAQQWEEFNGPKVIILEEGRGDSWREAERFWIDKARKLGITLYNRTDGG